MLGLAGGGYLGNVSVAQNHKNSALVHWMMMDLSLVVGKLLCKCLFDGCRTSAPAWPDQDGPHKPGVFHLFLPQKGGQIWQRLMTSSGNQGTDRQLVSL